MKLKQLTILLAFGFSTACLQLNAQTLLINGDFNAHGVGGPTQTDAAVLGISGDIWNGLDVGSIGGGSAGTFSTIVDSLNNTLTGITVSYSGGGGFGGSVNTGGTAMDVATTSLMEDYIFSHGGTVGVSITGLSAYAGNTFTLVAYAAGDGNGQGNTLTLPSGASSGSWQIGGTTATTRQISLGDGVAYDTFTGVLNGSTLTFDAAALGGNFNGVNGFQLQITPVPEPSSVALCGIGMLGLGCIMRCRKK